MLKLTGIAVILISCSALGCGMSRELSERVKMLCELERILQVMKGEIQYAATPLQEVFYELAEKTQEAFSMFFRETAQAMEQHDGRSVGDIFSDKADILAKAAGLCQSDIGQLVHFGRRLGAPDRKMQVQTIQLYQEELARTRAAAEEDYRQKAKVYKSLGFLGGCFCVLLLL